MLAFLLSAVQGQILPSCVREQGWAAEICIIVRMVPRHRMFCPVVLFRDPALVDETKCNN